METVAEVHGWTVALAACDGGARFEFAGVVRTPDSVDGVLSQNSLV